VEILRPSNLALVALVFVFSLNLAPMMFESFTSDRIWTSNPPESMDISELLQDGGRRACVCLFDVCCTGAGWSVTDAVTPGPTPSQRIDTPCLRVPWVGLKRNVLVRLEPHTTSRVDVDQREKWQPRCAAAGWFDELIAPIE
jgi:hypothetical protein